MVCSFKNPQEREAFSSDQLLGALFQVNSTEKMEGIGRQISRRNGWWWREEGSPCGINLSTVTFGFGTMTHSIVSSRWILLFSVYLVVHIPTIVFTRTVNGDASHPEIRIQDPFYGGLTFRRGEDVFGRFSRSEKELSPKEIRDREIKRQKDEDAYSLSSVASCLSMRWELAVSRASRKAVEYP